MTNKNKEIDCSICGLCCIAYSISTLNKKAGERCIHLNSDNKCNIYNERPLVCRQFKADNLCVFLSTLSRDEQINIIKEMYDA